VISLRLQPGDELHCPHCGRWHLLFAPYADGTPYMQAMLSWLCREKQIPCGAADPRSDIPTRRPAAQTARHDR